MRQKSLLRGSALSFVVTVVVCALPHEAAADAWQKIDDSDGIAIYRRQVAGSDVIAFRGEGVIAAPLVRVASAAFDTARAPEWIDSLADARVVRRISDTEYVEYDHFKMPVLIADRDFVTLNRLEYDPARKSLTIRLRSTTDPAAPPTNHVRGQLISSTFVLTPTADGKGTFVTGDVHCDPRGALPTWLVNMVQKDWPHSTFKALRAQVRKPNIVENPAIKRLVEPPPAVPPPAPAPPPAPPPAP
jgi:hypothetical protein